MSSNNSIIGFVPAATVYDCYGNAETLYRPIFKKEGVPGTESTAPTEAHQTDEEWEAGEAFAAEVAGLESGMTKEEQDAGEEFAADVEAREWANSEDDRVDDEQAHIGKLQDADLKKEELHKRFRELYKLSEIQKPLYMLIKALEAEKDPQKRGKNKTKYWETWNRMVAAQKDWLGTLEELKALDAEITALDPEHEFNTLANKTWYPDEPDRDYWALYAMISRNFKSNISRDEKRRANMHKPATGSAPAPATLADVLSAQLAKEAAGGKSLWGDM